MKQNKEVKISYMAAHLTTIVSVTLVLILIGIISLICISARNETRRLKSQIELSVVMADSVSDADARQIALRIDKAPYSADVRVVGKEEAMRNWQADTGENLEALFGVNPLSPEVCFKVRPEYSGRKAIDQISASLRKLPGVEDVAAPDAALVEAMNANIEGLAYVLGGIAIVMIVISFVLINNTVHLTIYSRRFTIHTMQLVGATDGFIRRPFILNNMSSGIVAGLVASAVIALALLAAPRAGVNDVASYISWTEYGIVAGSLVATGGLLCALAAWIATTRYLGKDYDELFK